MKARYFRGFFLLIFTALTLQASAQWRITTPRDTVHVSAKKKQVTNSKIKLNPGVELMMWVSGQYKMLSGTGVFDGGYCIKFPGWVLPQQLRTTPPYYYNSAKYEFGLKYQMIPGFGAEYWFVPIEQSYQSNNTYTAKAVSSGSAPTFFIKTPDDSYYTNASDSLTIRLARWTAGICHDSSSNWFGNVAIGASKIHLDSIASYGIDPLQVDSIKIVGPDAAAFSFISQRPPQFTLPNELANQIQVIFTPQKRGYAYARLEIYCKNTDAPSKIDTIALVGKGIEPTLTIGSKSLDFGTVRVGYPKTLSTVISNLGNSDLIIDQLGYKTLPPPDVVFGKSGLTSLPMITTPGSTGLLYTTCSPKDTISYNGFVYITGNNNLKDTIACKCRGAKPIPVFSDSVINFGQTYTGDKVSRTLKLKNKGNWPVAVIGTQIVGFQKAAFSFSPSDPEYIVESDSTRVIDVFFHPGIGSSGSRRAYLVFTYDDNSIDSVLLLGDERVSVLIYSKNAHDFGKVKVGAVKTDTVCNITNTGLVAVSFEERDVRPSTPFTPEWINSIAPQTTVPQKASFAPPVAGPFSAWIFLKALGKPDSILLTGIGAIAKAIVNPNPLDFGIVKSNVPSTKTVTVTDSGTLALNVVRYEVTGPDKADFRVVKVTNSVGTVLNTPFTIIESATVAFDVEFKTNARTGAAHIAQLCLYYDDNTSDCIPLQGIEEAQYVQFATSAVDFQKVRLKNRKVDSAAFRNGSNLTLSVGSTSIVSQTDVFTVVGSLTPIAPGATLSVPVEFYPTVRGVYDGYLRAQGGDIRTDSIQLRGIGAAPIAIASDTIINFGKVPFQTQSAPDSFFIVNINDDSLDTDWPFRADSIFLRGDEYDEFTWRSAKYGDRNTTDTIEVGDLSNYTVYFHPKSVTIYHDAELVFLQDDGQEIIVRLVGLDESPNIVLGEDTLNFGKVRVGNPLSKKNANLINTWIDTLFVGNLKLEPPTGVFASITPLGNNIRVLPNLQDNVLPVELTFSPTAAGMFSAQLISSGRDALTDTTFLVGEGAAPKPQFTPDTVLNFGDVLYSTPLMRTFELKNIGNWLFSTIEVKVVGTNASDFTANIANIINIEEDSARTFSVTFLATTPIQTGARIATIEFTLDDSSKVTYDLLAYDRPPFPTDLRWDKVAARIGDIVYPNLRLVNAIPDSLKIDSVVGDVAYDMSVVNFLGGEIGEGMIGWALSLNNSTTPGIVHYEISSTTERLTKPVSLLRLKFKAKEGVQPGAQSPLDHVDFDYPGRKEVQAMLTNGVIIIDSTCGDTHITASSPKASFIEQNRPNPFGASLSPTTDIPFTVGSDDTPVSLRILDMTGNEVLRLINGTYARGRYSAKIDASQLPSGTYMYEYRAGTSKPQVKKLVVGK